MADTPDETRAHVVPDPDLVTWRPSAITLEGLRGIDPSDVVAWLAHLSAHGNVTKACAAARISRAHVYRMRKEIPEFKEAWTHAIRMARDNLEAEAYRRAVEGVERPVYQGGQKVGTVREFSDSLLTIMLRARHPSYAKTAGGTNVNVDNRDQSQHLHVGPPEPTNVDLAQYVNRLGELAQKHLPAKSEVDNQAESE